MGASKATTLSPASTLSAEAGKLLACVHCGLCLEACPTYVHTGDENDGPRGRIYLMRAVEEGRLPVTSRSFSRHIDRCLGCRACESACPAGVEYGQLLEAARSDIAAQGRPHGWTSRLLRLLLRRIWLRPRRLGALLTSAKLLRESRIPDLLLRTGAAHLLPRKLRFMLALLEGSSPSRETKEGRASFANHHARGPANGEALLFKGCVTEALFGRVNRATARVLRANGCESHAPEGQVCCGALHAHAGDLEGARALARRNLDAFGEGGTTVVTNAGGCGAMLASYGQLLAGDPEHSERARSFSSRVRDVSQLLSELGPREGAGVETGVTTYDASCHLLHGQRADVEPLRTLEAARPSSFVPLEGSDRCCGGAGVYNLLEPELSARVLEEKLARVRDTGAHTLATGNPGCHVQLAAGARLNGMKLRVCHPVELLDESYARAGFYDD